MRFRSRDLRNDRIAKRSSRGSRYVDYIVLTGGSSARRCTKASTTLAHISPCFHLPTHSLCLSLSLFEYSLRSLIFLYTVPPMLSSLFVRLRTVFLCCTFTYYLPAKCTFHSQDPLSTLPPLFSLSSFSPVSSRFTETSVPPANKINASISCIFAFDENVETRGLLALRFCQFLRPSFSLAYAIEHRSQWQRVKRFSKQRRSCRLTPFAAPFMEFLLTRQSLLYMYTYLSRIPREP